MAYRRNKVGMRGVRAAQERKAQFAAKGSELAEAQMESMRQQLEVFKTKLEEFAAKRAKDIRKNPDFRREFQQMCAHIGVDPLASNRGFWSELLGMGDFYYEVGVQVVEVCLATRNRNGGLIELEELRRKVLERRGRALQDVDAEDLERAIKKLNVLGTGFRIIPVGAKKKMVQSVPTELNTDHAEVMATAEGDGVVSVDEVCTKTGWSAGRAQHVLDELVKEGMIWVDDQGGKTDGAGQPQRLYWFPSLV